VEFFALLWEAARRFLNFE